MSREILTAINAFSDDIASWRHAFHAHPETYFEETHTAAFIADKLRGWGIDVVEGVGKTGVVGTLKGKRQGQRAIALRSDMDALNIQEKTGVQGASKLPGKMHACGHDGHAAMLLGAARYLAEQRDFAGTVHFVFQPAEEELVGGSAMIKDGLFDRFPCEAIYGMHTRPGFAAGKLSTKRGAMFAAGDRWEITFNGTGGHAGSTPHLATDPTIVLGHFILALQAIVGRNVAPMQPSVLSIGHISAGIAESPGIIPPQVRVIGLSKSFDAFTRDTIERRLRELANTLAAAYGCHAEIDYVRRCPALINCDEQVKIAIAAAIAVAGEENVESNQLARTASDDFAHMLEVKPGAFMMIGNGLAPDGSFHSVHTPLFDFNDEVLALGAAYFVSVVALELGQT